MPWPILLESFITVLWRISMKQITLSAVMLVMLLFSMITNAGEEPKAFSVISGDGKVVIAVRPYFTKEEMKRIDFRNKKYVPMGIIIQNYSKNEIKAGWPQIMRLDGEKGGKIPYISPYRDRSLGQFVNMEFYTDAEKLNKQLHDQYAPRSSLPMLTIGEPYSQTMLGGMEAIYGFVLLKSEDRPDVSDNTVIEIPFNYKGSVDGFVAKFSLHDENNVIVATDKTCFGERKSRETLNSIEDVLTRRRSTLKNSEDPDPTHYPIAVRIKVQSNILHETVANCKDQPNTKFLIHVDEEMNVVSAKPEDSNMDTKCSEGVVKAIQKSSPFQMPPKSMYKEAVAEGFVFTVVQKKKTN